MKKFFKILLLRHVWSDFEMISQKGSLDDPFQKLLAKFLSFKKHGSGEWGLLAVWPFLRTKSVTKKETNKCMAEIYDPGGIRTRAAQLINQYHNH